MDIDVRMVPPSEPYIAVTFKNQWDDSVMSTVDKTFALSRAEAHELLVQLQASLGVLFK